jgi:hypothetical protein
MRIGVARGITEGEKLLQVSLAQSGGSLQLAARGVIEKLADAHQTAGKCPSAFERTAFDGDEIAADAAIAAREEDGIDGDLGARVAILIRGPNPPAPFP